MSNNKNGENNNHAEHRLEEELSQTRAKEVQNLDLNSKNKNHLELLEITQVEL